MPNIVWVYPVAPRECEHVCRSTFFCEFQNTLCNHSCYKLQSYFHAICDGIHWFISPGQCIWSSPVYSTHHWICSIYTMVHNTSIINSIAKMFAPSYEPKLAVQSINLNRGGHTQLKRKIFPPLAIISTCYF
jgi:hypothetical protein